MRKTYSVNRNKMFRNGMNINVRIVQKLLESNVKTTYIIFEFEIEY